MPIVKIQAKNFDIREDLDREIIRLTGSGTEDKSNFIVEGKRAELKKLHLDETKSVYGVKCDVTDGLKEKRQKSTADRGLMHPFGINDLKKLSK